MHGAIRKRDIITHAVTTIQCFGWEVFLRSLLASREQSFLSIVAEGPLGSAISKESSELTALAIGLESRVMELYRSLARRFIDVESLHELFVDLARQEESHAELLKLCRASCGRQSWVEEHLEPWRTVLIRLKDDMPSFERRMEESNGPGDALRLVIDIESSEINDAFKGIIEANESSFVRAVNAFRSAQQEHIELICRTVPGIAPDLTEACQTLREKHRSSSTPRS